MRLSPIAALAAVLGILSVPPAVSARETPLASAPGSTLATLTVTGEGRISRAPDLATVAVSLVTNDENATRALSENNRRFATLGAKLAATGIAPGDLLSTSIQSFFNPRQAGSGSAGPFGFIVTRDVEIRVSAFAQLGAVVDAATAAGATQVNGVTYGFRDPGAVERAALAAAVADAYAQAQAIAGAAHVQVLRVLRIGSETPSERIGMRPMALARKAEEPVPTTITPSDIEVDRSISITYAIR